MDQMLFNPQQMQEVGKLPLFLSNEGFSWMDRAKQADQSTLAGLMQERQRKSQEFDLLQKQRQATLEGTMLGNQGTQLTNEELGMTNQVRKATLPQEIQAKLDNYAKTADDTKWAAFENKIKTGMASDDPKVRAQAIAVYERLPAAVDSRRKHQEEMAKVHAQGQAQRDVAKIGADSRQQIQSSREKQARDLAELRLAAKSGSQSLTQLAAQYIRQAAEAADEETRQYYNDLANTTADLAARMTPAGTTPVVNPQALGPNSPLQNRPIPQVPAKPGTATMSSYAKPTTQADYDKLPSGTVYWDTDGKLKRKK